MGIDITLEGVSPKLLIGVQGPRGTFYMQKMPVTQTAPTAFFYGDQIHQFFGYYNYVNQEDGFVINIYGATTSLLEGFVPKYNSDYVDIVEINLKYFFLNHNSAIFSRLIVDSKDKPSDVVFSWKVRNNA